MSQQNLQLNSVEGAKRNCPIIAGSLILGVVITAGIIIPDKIIEKPIVNPSSVLFELVFAGVCFLAAMIVPNFMAKSILSKNKPSKDEDYPNAYQTQMIIRLALLEAAAFTNIFGVTSENYPWTLGIIIGLILTMILFFPTPGRIDAWIKQKKELAEFPQQDADSN